MIRSKKTLQFNKISSQGVIYLCVLCGILIGLYDQYYLLLPSIIGIIVFLCIKISKNKLLLLTICVISIFIGTTRSIVITRNQNLIYQEWTDRYLNKNFQLVGNIVNVKTSKISSKEILVTDLKILNTDELLEGKIVIKTNNYPELKYGEVIKIDCVVVRSNYAEDNFDYDEYLKKQGIYGMCLYPKVEIVGNDGGNFFLRFVSDIRMSIESKIDRNIPEPEASLLAGSIIGIKRYLPEEFEQNLKRTGTSHIVVVSGANISFVLILLLSSSSYLGKNTSLLLSLGVILFYVFLVGFDPPVVRSLCMFIPVILGKFCGREIDTIVNILLTAAIILLIDPMMTESISFQLSFSSTIGLILLNPIFQKIRLPFPAYIKESLFVSLSAQIMTLPIIIYNFNELSLVSIIINVLVTPLIPLITYGGFLFVFIGLLSSLFMKLVGLLLYLPLRLFVLIVTWSGSFAWSSIAFDDISLFFVLFYYFGVITFIIFGSQFFYSDEEGLSYV